MGSVTEFRKKFGRAAIDKGLVTKEQVNEALRIQKLLTQEGKPHKLIGIIMLELGYLSSTDLIDLLKELDGSAKVRRAL